MQNFGLVIIDSDTGELGGLQYIPVWCVNEDIASFRFVFLTADENEDLPQEISGAISVAGRHRAVAPAVRRYRQIAGGKLEEARAVFFENLAEIEGSYDGVKSFFITKDPVLVAFAEQSSELGYDACVFAHLKEMLLAGVARRTEEWSGNGAKTQLKLKAAQSN